MSSWPRELEALLQYEVRSSARNRRFTSLVMVAVGNGGNVRSEDFLQWTIRQSDAVFEWEADRVILMGETDKAGALEAVKRYRFNCADSLDLRFAVSSYPEDGQTARALLRATQGRMRRAKALRPGTVISSG